jgi:mRNA interferase MazF
MTKGEIWLTQFPQTDGHEQSGTRPVIVLSELDPNTAIVIPFTTNIQALRYSNTIEVHPSQNNGLLEISIALIFQLRAIDRKRLIKKTGNIETIVLSQIDQILKHILQL